MKKRTISAALWLYTGWYAGSLLAVSFGVSPLVGVIPGAIAACLILAYSNFGIQFNRRIASRAATR
jgi:hypothetical protein